MDNYVYFRKRGFFSSLSNGNQNTDALSTTNFGIVPANRAYNDGLTEAAVGIQVYIRALSTANDTRGTALSALLDRRNTSSLANSPTGATPAFTEGLTADVDRSDIGDATILVPASYVIASGVLQIRDFSTDGTNGYLLAAADQIIVRESLVSTNDALTDVPAINQAGCFNVKNYIGCDPVDTGTAAVIGVDLDGTLLDATLISFKGADNGATVDTVRITHAANKYKDVCIAMEEIANANNRRNGKGMITFTDLIGGANTKYEQELGIVGCSMINTVCAV
jgi:hypothetical protein